MSELFKSEKVTLNLPIPIGYRFKSLQLEVDKGEYVVSVSSNTDLMIIVTDKISLKDKNFKGTYFIVVEPI